jgi:hypothetical protein
MKNWLRILSALLIVAACLYGCRQLSNDSLHTSIEQTRRKLRQQGFRTELYDFNFALPAEIAARANAIISAGQAIRSLRNANELELMQTVGTNVAVAVSPIEIIETYQATNLWPLVKDELADHDAQLDGVCAALFAGPVKFQPTVRLGGAMLLPYLADHKTLARVLAVRAVLAMHEHNTNGVFTNLFALSRMVTAWTPEPIEISHMVRFACEGIAQRAIWESMQADYWNETQLALLQREWESVRFFEGLPETAELSCANMVRTCEAARDESYSAKIGGWGTVFRGIFSSPKSGFQDLWWAIQGYRQHASYRNRGSYEDEKALLLYYRDRNRELKRAISYSTWAEMRPLPGATNIVAFQGARTSRIQAMMNVKQLTLASQSQGLGPTLLARAAAAEASRRLIVTAIALERYAIQHREYPKSLADVVPAFLPAVPVDFMDGRELRYRRLDDGRYLLYSVGLDCVDNGGQMITPEHLSTRYLPPGGTMILPHLDTDIVWALRATQADVDLFEAQRKDYQNQFQETTRKFWQRYEVDLKRLSPNDPPTPSPPSGKKPQSSDKP